MKRILTVLFFVLFAALSLAAQGAKPRPGELVDSIPDGAEKLEPGVWRWTDKAGKVWFYRQTPFGIDRMPDPTDSLKPGATDKEVQAVVPKDAKLVGRNRWEWTDKAGKKWIYVRSPFGITTTEAATVAATEKVAEEKKEARVEGIVVLGETEKEVKFTRPGPFGNYTWSKKKSDLEDYEREALRRKQAADKPAAPKSDPEKPKGQQSN
jgi:hypothetical protein